MTSSGDASPVAPHAASYVVEADYDPQIVLRILNFFAQRDLAPDQLIVRRRHDRFVVSIIQSGIDEHAANIVALKMGALPLVCSVQLDYGGTRVATSAQPVDVNEPKGPDLSVRQIDLRTGTSSSMHRT